MEVVLTGTGSPMPDAHRAGPSTLIKAGEMGLEQILFDAGRAVMMRMAAAGSMPQLLSGICITHLHSDHLTDLNDLITTQWIATQEPTALKIWGPVGIQHYVDHIMEALRPDVGYRIAHHDSLSWEPVIEVTEVQPGDTFEIASFSLSVHQTCHAPVEPAVGYRIEREGKVVAIAGDTIPCEGLDTMTKDADIYVQTVIRDDIVKIIPMDRLQDILDYHSSVIDAAQTAAKNGVKKLMLTHYVPAPTAEQYPEWIAIAAEHFDGEIIMGDDLTTATA